MSWQVIGYADTVECEYLCTECGEARMESVGGDPRREFLNEQGIYPVIAGSETDEWEACAICGERLEVWPIEWARRVALECRAWANEWANNNPEVDIAQIECDDELPMIWLNLRGVMGICHSDYWQGGHLGAVDLSIALEEGERALHYLEGECVEQCSQEWR